MELSPVQRFVAFVVVVLVLAGLGVYLFLPHRSAADGRVRAHPRCADSASARRCASPAPVYSASPVPSGQSAPDIYQWLPFTQAGLASAASVTTTFAQRYGTFSYTQSAQAYLASMRPLMTSQLAVVLGRAFDAPGLAGTRVSTKQVATATAAIKALRAFGPTSLTFLVAIAQRLASTKGTTSQSTDYAVTVTGTGTSWQVSDIQLASAGNL
jgi:ABC-type multidrug transport system fused ATPase/permease subunit